jgi:hypothetical protein
MINNDQQIFIILRGETKIKYKTQTPTLRGVTPNNLYLTAQGAERRVFPWNKTTKSVAEIGNGKLHRQQDEKNLLP